MECGSAPLAQDHIFQEDTKDQFVGEQDCVSKLRGEMIPKLDKLPLYSPDSLWPRTPTQTGVIKAFHPT